MQRLITDSKSKKLLAWLTIAGVLFVSLPLCELSACHPTSKVTEHHQTNATAEGSCHGSQKPKTDSNENESSTDDCAHCVLQLFAKDGDLTQSKPTKYYQANTNQAKTLAQSSDSTKELTLTSKNVLVVKLPGYYFYTSLSLYGHSYTRTNLFVINSTWLI